MKKRFSLLLAIVMVIAMVLPMLPMLSVPTVAAEESNAVIEVVVDGVSTKYTAADIVSKFGENSNNVTAVAAKTGKAYTVNILDDIEVIQSLWFYPGVDTTINGNGHKITAAEQSKWMKDGAGNYVANRIFGLQGNSVTGAKATITGLVVDNTTGRSCNVTQMYTMAEVNLGEGNHWVAREKVLWYTNQNITFNITGGYYEAGAEAFHTHTNTNVGTLNITDGVFVTRGTGNAINTTSKMTLNMTGGAVVGKINATGTSSITGGYCSGTVTGATPGANFVTGAVAGIGSKGYTTIDAAFAAAAAATSSTTITVVANATMSAQFKPTHAYDVTVEGIAVNGVNPKITTNITTNKFRLEGGANYTFKNVDILNEKQNGCLFQIFKTGNLTVDGCNITTSDQYHTFNIMGKDGNVQNVTIKNSTVKQLTGSHVIVTGNSHDAGDPHFMHAVINVENSTIEAKKQAVSVSSGSTAAILIKTSTLKSADGHVVSIVAPSNLKGDSAKINLTTCYYDAASVFTPKEGSMAVNAPSSANVVVGVIEATYQEGDGEVEYVSLQGALTKASSATKDVTINLYKDANLAALTMTGSVNVTVNGDLGNGSVAKITYTGKTNMIRWNAAAGKTLTFKNVAMDLDASTGCVFQLSQQSDSGKDAPSNNLTLENVNMTAKFKWNVINVMANDGGTPVINITNSTINATPAADGSFHGIVMSGNEKNKYPNNLDLNITNSTLTSENVIRINDTSTIDLDVVKSTLTATGDHAIVVSGTATGSTLDIDAASTITVPAGKKYINATAPGVEISDLYRVVAKIYADDAETPVVEIVRKDFATAFVTGSDGKNTVLYTNDALKDKDVKIEILEDIDVGTAQLAFLSFTGKTLTIDGDPDGDGVNAKITGSNTSNPTVRAYGAGTIVFDSIDYHKTANNMMQFYNGVTVNIKDSNWTSGGNCFAPSGSGTINVMSGTTITTAGRVISIDWSCNGSGNKNTFNIEDGATLKGDGGIVAGNIDNTRGEPNKSNCALVVNINGGILTGNINPADYGTYNINGGTLTGNVTCPEGATLTITAGTINGYVTVTGNSTLTMTGGKIENSVNGVNALNIDTATATISGATIITHATSGNPALRVCNATVTISDSTLEALKGGVGAIYCSGAATLTVNNCTVTANPNGTYAAISDNSGGTNGGEVSITINGGKYTSMATTADKVVYGYGPKTTVTINDAELIGKNGTIVVKDGVGTHYVNAGESVDFVGAEARLKNNGDNGLRFVNTVSAQLVESLKALATGDLEFHTIVLPKEYIEKYNLSTITHKTLEGIEVVDIVGTDVGVTFDEAGNARISAALVNIKGSHYEWEFVSVVYVTYTDANGETVYVYGDNTAEALQARSIKSVAQSALDDVKETQEGDYRYSYNGGYSKYIGYKRHVLEAFAGLPGAEMPEPTQKPTTPPAAPDEPKPEEHKHNYIETVTPPTCYEPGYTTYTCTSCGNSYTGAETAPKHDAITHVAAAAATCTENGNIEYWFCETCGSAWLDEACMLNTNVKAVVLPAGHVDANEDYKCDGCSTKMLPEAGEALTIPQALAIAKLHGHNTYTTQKYYITGIITGLYNTTYGNFYIEDKDGNQICIYGLYSYDGETGYNAMSYKPVNGDEITVYTVLGMYNSTAQGKNAWMDEVVAHEHDYKAVVTAPTCTKGGYTTHTCSICDGYYTDTETPAAGHTTENGVCDGCGQTIGGDGPVNETFKADFDTVASTTSSYVTSTTDSGWKATNAAVMGGGTSDSNPKFKVFGAASTRAFTLNGKTSAKGNLVSPTIAGGLSKLTFNYTNCFSESNGVDITITIKQNGTVVATKRLDNNSVTKLTAYTFEWDLAADGVAVKGDFTIEITNNSPSNNTGNKDRVSIWNLEWTTNK